MVPDRCEVAGQEPFDVGEPCRRPWSTLDCRLEACGALRTLSHAAIGRPQFADLAALAVDPEGGNHGRNVLVETLRHLVDRELMAGREEGNADRTDHFALRERGLAIAGDEGFDRQGALAGTRSERYRGVERHQAGDRVADR